MVANSRESRRRKILERGPDRLAFITGQIPPSQLHPQLTTDSSQPSVATHQPHLPDQTTVSTDVEDKENSDVSGSVLPEHDPVVESVRTGVHDTGSNVEQPLSESGTGIEANGSTVPSSSVLLTNRNPSSNVEPRQIFQHRIFNPSRLKSAIVATEIARLFCSVAVGVLVVLSGVGFPLLGSNDVVKSIVSFRPLYLVLVTNVTIVIWRLMSDDKQGGYERASRGGLGIPLPEQASKLLEAGLVMQKVIDAFFMDCSVYALIIICGLSFVSLVS